MNKLALGPITLVLFDFVLTDLISPSLCLTFASVAQHTILSSTFPIKLAVDVEGVGGVLELGG